MTDNGFVITKGDEKTCATQARLYKYVHEHGYDIVDFSDRYLASDFCNRQMDAPYSVFQREDPLQMLDFILPEFGDKDFVNRSDFTTDCLKPIPEEGFFINHPYFGAWEVGYLYRYLHFMTGLPSREIVSILPTEMIIHEMKRRMDWNLEEIAEVVANEYLGVREPREHELQEHFHS